MIPCGGAPEGGILMICMSLTAPFGMVIATSVGIVLASLRLRCRIASITHLSSGNGEVLAAARNWPAAVRPAESVFSKP